MNTRAGRLTDGPYTSYDLNTLLKATAGKRRAVLMGQGKPFAVLSNEAKLKLFLLGRRKGGLLEVHRSASQFCIHF